MAAFFFHLDFALSVSDVAANLKLSRFLTPKMRPNYPLRTPEREREREREAASFRAWANSRMDGRTDGQASEVIGEGWN